MIEDPAADGADSDGTGPRASNDPGASRLVEADSTVYDRGVDWVVALGVVALVLGLLTLVGAIPLDAGGDRLARSLLLLSLVAVGAVGAVALASRANVVPVTSRRLRGVAVQVPVATFALTVLAAATGMLLATLLGLVLVGMALTVATAGVSSRVGVVDTSPDETAGLLAGVAFGGIGVLLGAALGGTLLGFGSPGWLLFASLSGLGLLALSVLPREDLGSTLPPAVVVGTLGVTVATAAIGVGWEWNPRALSGGFTGGTVVPLFVLLGAVVSAWAAAKCRAGFGARGREYGAFLVINLNAGLMIAAMVAIVGFVTAKGAGYAFHGFTVGALSLLVLLGPLLVLAVRFARQPPGSARWHPGARHTLRVLPLAACGALAAVLLSALLSGRSLVYPFTYTVQVDRQPKVLETAITVTADPTVAAPALLASGAVLFVICYRRYGSLKGVGVASATVERLRVAATLATAGLLVGSPLVAAVAPSGGGPGLVGVTLPALVAGGALGAVLLAAIPTVGILTGYGATAGTDGLAERIRHAAPLVPLGVFGGLGLLTATLAFQTASGVLPSVGPVNVVPVAAVLAALATLALAGLAAAGRRRANARIERTLLAEVRRLGLAGVGGFLALVGGHVRLVDSALSVFGVTVSQSGTFAWPMTMQAYVPLGVEPGGIMPAIVGTVWLVVGATLFAVPLGVGAAIFLTEYAEQGRFTTVVEVATNALWSTPSVVFGLFGAAFLIPRLGGDSSLLAGMLVLGFMLLPLVLITSREAIKAVPDEYRDASAALGVTRWQTIRSVVLPAAMPGVITGGILGVGRVAGETAPLILVLGSTLNATDAVDVLGGFRFVGRPPFVVNDQLLSASASLPTQVWAVIAAGVSGSPSMGWATAFVLLGVVLTFYAVGIASRTYFSRKIHHD